MNSQLIETGNILELRDGLFYLFPSVDEIEIRRDMLGEPVFKLRDHQSGGWLKGFFESLDGKQTVEELLSDIPEARRQDARKIVEHLKRKIYIPHKQERISGPKWFKHLLAQKMPSTDEYFKVFSQTSFCVIGSGTLAKNMLEGLRDFKAKRISMVDVSYQSESASRSAGTEHAAKEQDNLVNIEMPLKELESYLTEDPHDFVIVAADYFDKEIIEVVNSVSVRMDRKWILCMVDGWKIYIGPTVFPGEGGCFECLAHASPDIRHGSKTSGALYRNAGVDLVNPGFAKIASGFVLADILNLIADVPIHLKRSESLTIARQTVINMETFEAEMHKVNRMPNCTTCKSPKLNKGTES